MNDQTICGERAYTVFEEDTDTGEYVAQTLVTFNRDATGAAHTLVTTTQDEADVGTHNMRLVVALTDPDVTYPVLIVDYVVTIEEPVCDCTLLEWQVPAAQTFTTTLRAIPSDTVTVAKATVVEVSKSASPKIRACYVDASLYCDETTVITNMIEEGSTFPTYFVRSGDEVTINGDDAAQERTYTMEVTHTKPPFTDEWITYNTLTITLNPCVITHIDTPVPDASGYSYIIFDT